MEGVRKVLNLEESEPIPGLTMTTSNRIEPHYECYKCGGIKPASQLRSRTIEVESGRRGSSMTLHGFLTNYSGRYASGKARNTNRRTKGISWNTGAKYYRNKNVLVCNSCVRQENIEYAASKRRRRIFWSGVALIATVWFVYRAYNPAMPTVDEYNSYNSANKVDIQKIETPIEIFHESKPVEHIAPVEPIVTKPQYVAPKPKVERKVVTPQYNAPRVREVPKVQPKNSFLENYH